MDARPESKFTSWYFTHKQYFPADVKIFQETPRSLGVGAGHGLGDKIGGGLQLQLFPRRIIPIFVVTISHHYVDILTERRDY